MPNKPLKLIARARAITSWRQVQRGNMFWDFSLMLGARLS
jgi:hypothetical protein